MHLNATFMKITFCDDFEGGGGFFKMKLMGKNWLG